MGPILFLYHDESLVSSNLNSKLLRFHSVRPNLITYLLTYLLACILLEIVLQNAWLYFAGYFIILLTSDSMIYARTNHQFSSRRTSEFDFPEITTFIRHL